MQVSPALPWNGDTGGTITLAEPVTYEQVLAGILIFMLDNGEAVLTAGQDAVLINAVIGGVSQEQYTIQSWEGETREITLVAAEQVNHPLQNVSKRTPMPINGDVQIFADPWCLKSASGTVDKVYARINVPWGENEAWGITTGDDGEQIMCEGPTTENPDQKYQIALWVDFLSQEFSQPFSEGQVIPVETGFAVDVSDFYMVFDKP